MMQGTIQTMHAECGFGCLPDANGGNVFSHRSAPTAPASFAILEVGIGVEFGSESGPEGPRAAKISVTLMDTPSILSCNELAASFQRHAAG
jgi:cold shock CspA family protein